VVLEPEFPIHKLAWKRSLLRALEAVHSRPAAGTQRGEVQGCVHGGASSAEVLVTMTRVLVHRNVHGFGERAGGKDQSSVDGDSAQKEECNYDPGNPADGAAPAVAIVEGVKLVREPAAVVVAGGGGGCQQVGDAAISERAQHPIDEGGPRPAIQNIYLVSGGGLAFDGGTERKPQNGLVRGGQRRHEE